MPALAPFIGLTGDYSEMGSILVTRSLSPLTEPPEPGKELPGVMRLRTDDPGALLSRFMENPTALAESFPAGRLAFYAGFTASALLGVIIAFATYALGDLLAHVTGLRT